MRAVGLTQRVEEVAGRGERRDCLDQAWAPLLAEAGLLAVPLPNLGLGRDPAALLDALGLAGVVLTGGNDLAHLPGARATAPERDAAERALLERCRARGLPVLGVCRGLQLLLAEDGAALERVADHAGRTHALVPGEAPGAEAVRRELVNSYHEWGVRAAALPPSWALLAAAPDGVVEAARHRSLPWWGIGWHPERGARDPRDVALLRRLFTEGGA